MDFIVCVRFRKNERIRSVAAKQIIMIQTTSQDIIAIMAIERVGAYATKYGVIALIAANGVGPGIRCGDIIDVAIQRVVAVSTIQDIASPMLILINFLNCFVMLESIKRLLGMDYLLVWSRNTKLIFFAFHHYRLSGQ